MNYGVARIETRTRESVGKFERHNERKNESYANMNVDLSRSHLNIHFRSPGGLTYNQILDQKVANGEVSLRGLKPDAKVFDEMVLDVNTAYFDKHGGYDYAVKFYEQAFRFAEEIYGSENIISAVMHADEMNTGLSLDEDRPVYHYHLHIMALPVVEKKVLWTKRCKDPSLVGTVKEVIHQISHSKKWASNTRMLDDNGSPVIGANGRPKYVASYSVLQDRFLDYMHDHGFTDIVRGERGSTTQHLTNVQYQIQKDRKRMKDVQDWLKKEEIRYESVHEVFQTHQQIEDMGHKTLTGKVAVSKEDYQKLTQLAKEGVSSRGEIKHLEQENSKLTRRLWDANAAIDRLAEQLEALREKCRPFLQALEHFPALVRGFVEQVCKAFEYKRSERDDRKPKKKDYERLE